MRNFILIIVISLFGFFVSFDFLGSIGNTILKIFLFFGLGYVLYLLYNEGEEQPEAESIATDDLQPQKENSKTAVETNLLSHNKESIAELLNDKELSLNSLLISQFEILYNFFIPSNGYIFFEIKGNSRLLYKSVKSGVEWKESQVAPVIIRLIKNHNDDILVENNLNQQSQILPFYDANNYSPDLFLE